MSKTRVWVFGTIAGMLVVVIAGWMLGISPIFAQITDANAQAATIQQSNAATQARLASLKVQFNGIDKLKAQLNKLRLSVPQEQAASAFIDEVTTLSSQSGVVVQLVTIASATLYAAPTAAAPAGTDGTSTATATPAPAGATATTAAPAVTASGLVLIPVVVSIKGTLAQDQAFVAALQTGQRLFVSSSLVMTSDSTDDQVIASITGDIFTHQGTSDPAPVKKTAPQYSTATPTPTPTPTPTDTTATTGSTSGTKTGNTPPPAAPTTAPTADPTPDPTATP